MRKLIRTAAATIALSGVTFFGGYFNITGWPEGNIAWMVMSGFILGSGVLRCCQLYQGLKTE